MMDDETRQIFRDWERRDREHYRGKERDIIAFTAMGVLCMAAIFVMFVVLPAMGVMP